MDETVRRLYGGPLARLAKATSSKQLLEVMAQAMIDSIVEEARKDFAQRGWSMSDPKGGPPLDESFSFVIRGKSTIEIRSSYWGLEELVKGDIPSRRMTWLTQEGKDKFPDKYPLTPTEANLGMQRSGRVSKNKRKPLVVPLKADDGTVVFRMAPMKMKDAWVHPGIAKFTFMERGIRKGKKKVAEAITKYLKEQMK
jgi:hypothetical protein